MHSQATSEWYLEQVNQAIDHIVAHLDQPLRLPEIAGVTAISAFHFHRIFQSLVGETPGEFSRRLRLEKALKLMAYSRRRSLTDVALECGFHSSSDFSRCFKKRFGASPRSFDIQSWLMDHEQQLESTMKPAALHVGRLPVAANPDGFTVTVRELPPRDGAYIRVARPYEGNHVMRAMQQLMAWAEQHGHVDGQWLGYQWDHPGITGLDNCQYYVAVEAADVAPQGRIGRFHFPAMSVAQIDIRGGIDLELRALQWLYGTWLPRSRYVPDDHPGFESWIGRPFAHGTEYFEIQIQLPVRSS
jgi:AraC family transcriptional regulator